MATERLLETYLELITQHGIDAPASRRFLRRNSGNRDFVELAEVARVLRLALVPSARHNRVGGDRSADGSRGL